MKSVFVVFSLLLVYHQSSAQVDSLVNSGQRIAIAKQLYDSGKYELAIKELNRIDPRDTNYIYSVSEKVKALIDNKQYKEGIAACESALKVRSAYRASLFSYMGLSYQVLGMYDQATLSVNEGLKEFPFEYNLMFRLGVISYMQDRFDDAEKQFFRTLDFTPQHLGSHLYLSKIAMRRGNKVEGMFAMGLYLALNNLEKTQMQILENFVKNTLTDEQTIPAGANANPFTRLDEFIRAKISFEKGYKLKIPVEDGIVRQYQLLFDQLSELNDQSESPWVRFYLKIYKDILKGDAQEPFIYHILKSSSLKEVSRWLDNHQKTLQKFYDVTNVAIKQFRGKHLLPENWGYKNAVSFSFDSENSLESIGDKNAAGEDVGKWYYFDKNAEILALGNSENNKKVGVWHYFKNDHTPASQENQETGEIKFFGPDGNVQEYYFLKDGHIEGKMEQYYACGALQETQDYHEGKKNGPGKAFFTNGKLKSEFEYKDGNLHGAFIKWRDDGTKESMTHYADGDYQGTYESYFANGKISAKGEYLKGKADGIWSYYFENGRLKQKGNFKSDSTRGLWETFNESGILTVRSNYDRHEDFDEVDSIYSNGTLAIENRLKENKMVSIIYYDKSGKVLGSYGNKEGNFKGKGYFSTGELRVEFEYVEGNRSNQWKFYTRYGALDEVNTYKNGTVDGSSEEFFTSGALKIKSYYKEGNLDGLYTEYYSNGKIKQQGWYVNGQKQQRWLSYYIDGTIASDQYFLNDEMIGYEILYSESSKIDYRFDFDSEGRIKLYTKYNAAGKASVLDSTSGFHSSLTQKYQSGVIASQEEFVCGNREEQTKIFLGSGKPFLKTAYRNGNLSGNYSIYFPDGRLETTGNYHDGSPSGYWKWNSWNGSKYCEGGYLNGEPDSTWTFYHLDNSRSRLDEYVGGVRQRQQLYGLNGELVVVKRFESNELIDYKVTKDGKLSDWIPFKGNETITSHYANGQVATTESYKNGVYHGQRKKYYPNGQLYSQDEYLNGEEDGDSFIYFQNGKVMSKTHNKVDKSTGVWEFFDLNGNLLQRHSYLSGTLNGPSEVFVNGKLVSSQNFFSGLPSD